MPYSSTSALPASVKKKYKSAKRRRQFMKVFNSVLKRTGSESRAFAAAHSTAKKELDVRKLEVADKAVKITQYTGVDDPDLPEHVGAMPVNVRRRWVSNFNYRCQECLDDEEAADYADDATYMSVSEMMEHMGSVKEVPESVATAAATTTTTATPTATLAMKTPAPADPGLVERFKQWLGMGTTQSADGARAPSDVPGFFHVFKQNDQWRLWAVYSNIFQDRAGQIVSEAAHKEYVEWVDRSKVYPEFHLWHGGPGSRFGQVDFVDYVNGFSIVSGVVDAGKEHIAIKLKELADKGEIAVSFGFLGLLDEDIYMRYRAFEMSPLPAGSEANPWTPINLLAMKEQGMAITDAKKAWYKTLGLDDAAIDGLDKTFSAMETSLKSLGINWKSAEPPVPTPPPTPEPTPEPTPPTPTPPTPQPPNALALDIGSLVTAVKELTEVVSKQGQELQALKDGQARVVVEKAAEDMVLAKVGAALGGGFSAARSPETVIAGMKQAPDEEWGFLKTAFDSLGAGMAPAGAGNGVTVAAVPQNNGGGA